MDKTTYYWEESYKDWETEIQAGFGSWKYTIAHVLIIKQLIEKNNNIGQEVHSTFVDIEKAHVTGSIERHGNY